MSYRFDPTLNLQENLRSVAREQTEKAIRAVETIGDDPEASIHDLRKRMKKLRALLLLFRPGLGEVYRLENEAARDIARGFAAIRDAQVMAQTVEWLAGEAGPESEATLAPLQDWAREQRAQALARDLDDRTAVARASLTKLHDRVADWRVEEVWHALEGGLAKSYTRGRKGLAKAQAGAAPDQLHDWRKRLKYHRYHCRLLRDAWPGEFGAREDLAHRLTDALGEDHDLQVLRQALSDAGLGDDVVQLTSVTAQKLAQTRRAAALTEAPPLFVEPPKRLARRLAGYWSCAEAAAAAR